MTSLNSTIKNINNKMKRQNKLVYNISTSDPSFNFSYNLIYSRYTAEKMQLSNNKKYPSTLNSTSLIPVKIAPLKNGIRSINDLNLISYQIAMKLLT